ncbi:[phosphatase 2A protein]-leucine-carboxy methyltransferase [Malassezia furfur]|uniref:Spindle assembly checkpoint component MAD1 n=1 Tax=Malassezia furfur TaxID=55194 RepID=A0ABY8ETL5_MALFU|nr:[phosphatase 2A protein]-leucine-carboxy methyltransferase [Malassezia furfur]
MRRTPQSVRRTPSVPAAVSGPLGAYRNLSRTHSTPRRADAAHDAAGLGKRSFSSTGLPDTPTHATPRETPKRTPLPPAAAESPSGASYELTMLRTEYDRRLAEEQRAYKQFESQLRTQSRELEALKHQRAEAAREWEAERAAQRAKEDAWAHTQRTLEAQLAQLRAESLQHQDTTHTLRAALRDAESRAHTRQSELQAELIDARSDAEQARADAAQARAHAAELERAAAERAAPEAPPAAPAADEAVDALKAELSQHITAVERLEAAHQRLTADNARLMAACEQTEILREANRGLEAKVQRMDALQQELLRKDDAVHALEAQHAQWLRLLHDGVPTDEHAAFVAAANAETRVPTPDVPALTYETLPTYVSTLRGTIMGLAARIEGLTHSMEQLRTANVDLERQTQHGTEKESSLASELRDKTTALLRVQRQLDVQADELRRCKELLASFETEARNDTSHTFDEVQAQRIADLDTRVHELQRERDTLATRCEDAEARAAEAARRAAEAPAAPAAHDDAALREAQSALEALQTRYAELEKHAAELGAENDQLYARVGRGEFDATRERCLVLQDNPVSRDYAIRTATLDALRKENSGLLAQIEALHEQLKTAGAAAPASNTDAVVPLQTVENLKQELARLQDTIQLKDKGMLRLKQVFTAKANEFREAVQSLFGYKLRFLENGKVKLTSAYARGARVTTLVFASNEGNVGEMKLQGEAADGLANVAHLRDYWLSDGIRHSVPCFLAALNLELYENTTQAIRGAFGADVEDP